MCGIVAALLNEPSLNAECLCKALERISHRGPDGKSTWVSADRKTLLGHVRLSIIGLENGEQPLRSASGHLHAVVNGEFYGYKEIRQSLLQAGYSFLTDTDSEIAVHLYDQHGKSFVNHLSGEFALVIADSRTGELIAARDRFGVKPLFCSITGEGVLFASEAKALFELGIKARWDHRGVLEDFSGTRVNRSLFADIAQIPPGCIAVAKNGRVKIERYWDITLPTTEQLVLDRRTDEEIVSEFRQVLTDAVRHRLSADVEVGCYLSGGLDSSAILGLAQSLSGNPIRAFTIEFEGEGYDESSLAMQTAAFTGSIYSPLRVSSNDMSDALEDAVWHGERPFFNTNVSAKFLLSKKVRAEGIKVVLTGEGADELFAGYQTEQRDFLLHDTSGVAKQRAKDHLRVLAANPAVRAFMFHDGDRAPGLDAMKARLGYLPSWIESFSIQYQSVRNLMRLDALSVEDSRTPYGYFLDEIGGAPLSPGRDAVNRSLYLWSKSMLVNYVLTVLGDRMEMSHSVEGRVPFLDHEVAEFSAALPLRFKFRDGIEKYILREATRDVISPEIFRRKKHPFFAPPIRLKSGGGGKDPLCIHCEDIIRSAAFLDQPFFDPVRARAFLDSASDGNIPPNVAAATTLRMATLSILQRRFSVA